MNVLVGSKTQADVVLTIEGCGLSPIDARRAAIQFARARHRISDPIPLTDHEAAIRMRQKFVAQFAPKMNVTEINGTSPMCFDNRYGNN
jgi:hypothetical protein